MEMLLQSWRVQHGQRVINSCGIGSMGFALSAAIGVAVKKNPKELLCIESDGSFAMNLQDLVTMSAMDTNFKVIIMDSSGYKSISLSQGRLGQESHGNSVATSLNLPDIKIVSNALGLESRQVSHLNELLESLAWLANQDVSSLLVVKVSQKEEALPRLVSKPNSQGVMVTPPMNMLFPEVNL